MGVETLRVCCLGKGVLCLPPSAAQRPCVPWGITSRCLSVHARLWASMPPKVFSLMPPSRGSTCTAMVLCPPSVCCVRLHSGPSCSVQLLCLGPRPPGRSGGVSAGTWAPGYWPRDPDQTPGREGFSMLTPRRCQVLQAVCGGHCGQWSHWRERRPVACPL